MNRTRSFAIFVLLLSWSGLSAQDTEPFVIVAFGDSITAEREGVTTYCRLLEDRLLEKTKLPVHVINAGVPGNTTAHALKRFEHEVLSKNPSMVIIAFGSNDCAVDVWKKPPADKARVSLSDYRANLQNMIQTLRDRDVAMILMTPNPFHWTPQFLKMYGSKPYDVTDPDGFNVPLRIYASAMRQVAAQEEVLLADVMAVHDRLGAEASRALQIDGMHPNSQGHQLIADLLTDLIMPQLARKAKVFGKP